MIEITYRRKEDDAITKVVYHTAYTGSHYSFTEENKPFPEMETVISLHVQEKDLKRVRALFTDASGGCTIPIVNTKSIQQRFFGDIAKIVFAALVFGEPGSFGED